MKKRAGLYIRVSTEEQVDNYSIPEQKRRLEAYCQSHDWAVAEEYIDGGFSGAKLDRPAMQKMISDSKAGNLDVIVSLKLDRLSRSQKDTLHLIEDIFLPCHVDYVSVNESFDTGTSFGRAMVGILSVFAQLEREQILERMHSGMEARAKTGLYHGSKPPYGYALEKGILKIDPTEAVAVRKVFDLWLKGYSYNKISEIMEETYHGEKAWLHPSAINQLLTNPAYTGKIRFAGEVIEGQHEPIIDEITFKKANLRLETRAANRGRQTTYLLTGVVWCGKCGGRYGINMCTCNGIRYTYYACTPNRRKKGNEGIKCCGNKPIPTKKLDPLIVEKIKKLAISKDFFEEIQKPDASLSNAIASLESAAAEIDKRIEKLMELYSMEGIPVETLSQQINTLYSQKKDLEAKISQKQSGFKQTYEDYKEVFDKVDYAFESGTIEEQKSIVRSLIKRIDILNQEITITWNFQ